MMATITFNRLVNEEVFEWMIYGALLGHFAADSAESASNIHALEEENVWLQQQHQAANDVARHEALLVFSERLGVPYTRAAPWA